MSWRAAPGEQLAAGRLRVDAAKAIAKLREYQLVDRTAWILEAIRAAVASNATSIELQGDSNDVWLSWRGEPWSVEDLPRLFDELVSPEPGASRHHVRLLAAAVNSALGANPAYIDVYAIGDGDAHRVRYTPDVLDTYDGDLEDSPLRRVKATPTAIPDNDAGNCMYVHYRRRASLGVLTTFLLRSEPLELLLARSACTDIAVPLRIGADTFDRATGERDIVRIPLGDDVEGWLAITNTPILDDTRLGVAERGVLLETRAVETGLRAARIPVRVFVDAPRMPTNASRSEVRADVHPVSTAVRRIPELMPKAIAKLVEKCSVAQLDARARIAALQFLTDSIAGHDWAMRAPEIDGPLRLLAELPLVRDAAGIPRPMCWSWSGLIYTDAEPLAPELAPWLSRVLWAPPNDPIRALAGYANPAAMRLYLKGANRERRAEKKFYKHAKREARVLDRRTARLRYVLGTPIANSCIPDGMFEGLAGEVCVYANGRKGSLTLLLSGREIETVEYDSSVGFAAVITSDYLKPANRYRGVERDGEYARVEQAMRAGVIRAIESITRPFDEDARLIRHGIFFARELQRPLSLAFAAAKVWRSTQGYLSIDDLRKHPVIGHVPPHASVAPLTGRPILFVDDVDARLLATYVKSVFLHYDVQARGERLAPHELALRLVESHALGLREDDLVIAIRPAPRPELRLLHRGVELATYAYRPSLKPCVIAIDCDDIVPTNDWGGVAEDGGVGGRDLTSVEHALARDAARALTGTRSPDLVGEDQVELAGPLGRWLCESIVEHANPIAVLGEDLVAALRVRPMVRMLGEARLFSIDEIAIAFPDTIAYVTTPTEPVEGVRVVVADALVVRLIAKLAHRKSRDVAVELAERRVQLARELRLAIHRAKPAVPLDVAGTHVEIASSVGKGMVGVGRDALEVRVLVESRPFVTITRPDEVPLAAVIELADLTYVDAKFEQLQAGVEDTIVSLVRNRTPDLVRAIADAYPDALAEPGPRRSLLARFLAGGASLAPYVREALARTIVFPTVQRGHTTITDARFEGSTVPTCAWHGDWLPADGDPHRLDLPIIYTGSSPELHGILSALCTSVDVTREVENLQSQRRIARGLLPTPRVVDADPELVFPLSVFGNTYRQLGPGEIALTGENDAAVLVHANGELRARMPIDCTPAILLAIEAADLAGNQVAVDLGLGTHARAMAIELAKHVLAKRSADSLPPAVRASLRAAMLAGKLADLRDVPVFETTNGTWIDLATVQAQRDVFSNLWCVAGPTTNTPLDERRIVLVMTSAHQALANAHGIFVVDATLELALDAKTRRNMAKPLLESLALDDEGILARVELPGDGVGSPRGVVAVLSPNAEARRGLQLSRRMHPFEPVTDPCRWPTLAIIDDERFTPDRTWEAVERNEIHKQAIDALHKASNDALRQIVQPPANAIASMRVTPWAYDSVALLRHDLQVRGALWLAGAPLPSVSPSIRVVDRNGEAAFVPLHGPNLAGTIYVCSSGAWPFEKLLEELCQASHAKLVRELLLRRSALDPDLVAAHVAWALSLGRIAPDDAKRIELKCFRPAPLDTTAALALFKASEPVVVVAPESKFEGPCFVDDGSETARVIVNILGARMRNATQRMRPDTVEPPPAVVVKHPLQPFVDRLHSRISALGVPVARWRIVDDRSEPIAAFSSDEVLELAADNKHLLAIAAAVTANTAWSADALDAIAAHCITVLNVALTSITDAAEARAIGKLLG